MALTAASLKGKIETNIKAFDSKVDSDSLAKFADAIAKAVVNEITTNATVPSSGLTAPSGGGAVLGTAKIK